MLGVLALAVALQFTPWAFFGPERTSTLLGFAAGVALMLGVVSVLRARRPVEPPAVRPTLRPSPPSRGAFGSAPPAPDAGAPLGAPHAAPRAAEPVERRR